MVPPTVSTVVTLPPAVVDAVWRTHTVWLLLMVPGLAVKVIVQPIEYSPPVTLTDVGPTPCECYASFFDGPTVGTFVRVVVPLAWPGILAGAVLTFAHTVGEFGVVLMIGGNVPGRTRVLSTAIFDFVENSQWREANTLAAGMVVFAFLVVLAMILFERRFAGARR